MKTFFRTFILAVLALAGAAGALAATVKPSDKYVVRKVSTGDFDAVRTNTSLDIVYTVGPRKVEIYAPDNLVQYIQVKISGSELIVNYKENMNIHGNHESCVRISAPAVRRFITASSGDIDIKSPLSLKNKTIELRTMSAGDIEALDIDAKEVILGVNSAGDIEVKDIRANDISMMTCSAGDIKANEVVARDKVNVITSSAGSIKPDEISAPTVSLCASSAGDISAEVKADKVSAVANSAGDIKISGICSMANLTSSSKGNVDARDLKAADVNACVSSIGNVYCWPIKQLTGYRSGTGSIRYKGKSAVISVSGNNRSGGVGPL